MRALGKLCDVGGAWESWKKREVRILYKTFPECGYTFMKFIYFLLLSFPSKLHEWKIKWFLEIWTNIGKFSEKKELEYWLYHQFGNIHDFNHDFYKTKSHNLNFYEFSQIGIKKSPMQFSPSQLISGDILHRLTNDFNFPPGKLFIKNFYCAAASAAAASSNGSKANCIRLGPSDRLGKSCQSTNWMDVPHPPSTPSHHLMHFTI